jgi:hypothetical protein
MVEIEGRRNLKDLYVAHVYLLMGVSFVQWSKNGLKILNPSKTVARRIIGRQI